MKILVCGSSGCIGSAVTRALRSRDHEVIESGRGLADGPASMRLDFMETVVPAEWAARLRERGIEAIVNCVGILMASPTQSFERIHAAGPIELFAGAALAGIERIVQISALGVRHDAVCRASPYMHSKLLADDALMRSTAGGTVLRPSLVYGPRSQSGRLFATLASLPAIGLPGSGRQALQPIHVYEVAEIVARLLEARVPSHAVHELGGRDVLNYRDMLAAYRHALGLGNALWLPVPVALMQLGARCAEWLPQKILSRDTLQMLEHGSVPAVNAATRLLGRRPTDMTQGLAIGRPEPLWDLRVELGRPVAALLRAALAFMWIYTALVSILLPQDSGVMTLLARCGFTGTAGTAALLGSCTLNIALGLFTLLRPSPLVYLVQIGAIAGYTLTAAWSMPELTIDHCGPLVKNLPVLTMVLALWLGHVSAPRARSSPAAQPTPQGRARLAAH